MNYKAIYDKIIERSKNRTLSEEEYVERHHIVPRCMNGTDEESNIALLTAREHYICHQLLIKIYPNNTKLIYAAKFMTVHTSQNRSKNRLYEWIRKAFVESHPCKEDGVKEKIKTSVFEYYNSEEYRKRDQERRSKYREVRFCACGCGQTFEDYKISSRKYIDISHFTQPTDSRKKQGKSLQKSLSELTKDEMSSRIRNSFGKADPLRRASAISKSKKGKRTNQQEIMGRRYASMSDEEFDLYIQSKKFAARKRMIRLREKWKNS